MSFSASVDKLVEASSSPLVCAAPWWGRIPLGCVAEILNGYPWKSAFFNDQGGVPVIRIRDVNSGTTDTLYRGKVEDGYWIEDGDVLIGMDGDFNSGIWAGGRALLNQRVCRIGPNEQFYLRDFMAHVLPGYLQLINNETHSITVRHLSSKTLAEIPLPLPPLPEQRRIVAKIDSLSAKSKCARNHLNHVPRLVERYKQVILVAAFQGDLTKEWRTRNAGRWPWPETSLSEIAEIGTGSTPKRGEPRYYSEGHIPWVTSGAVNAPVVQSADECITDAAIQETNCKVFPTGTLLMAMYGEGQTRGRVAVLGINAATNQALAAIQVGADGPAVRDFVLWHLRSGYLYLRHQAAGGVQPNLNLGIIKAWRIPLPSREEQHEIVRRIEYAFTWINRLASEATSPRKLIDHLDQAVLAKAFRGELVPQDPSDEPASVLLERIRAERAATPSRGKRDSTKPVKAHLNAK